MDKILFITNRNVLETSGELRLIKNRSFSLGQDFGIKSDYLVYRLRKPDQKRREKIDSDVLFFYNPKEKRKLKNAIDKKIAGNKYLCVILSGFFVLQFLPYIKKRVPNIKIVIDIHGTIAELKEFKNIDKKKQLLMDCLYKYALYNEKKYIPRSDGILAVSKALVVAMTQEINFVPSHFFIVPCGVSQKLKYEKYKQWRSEYRKKYGLNNEDIVFIYSGGNSPWQCVEQSVLLFKQIKEKIYNRKCIMFLFSGSKELINKYRGEKDIIVDSLDTEKVTETLCVGDYGFMLRENFETNNVAFPNKFLEYVLSGLKIITTPYVYDVVEYVKEYQLGIVINRMDDAEKIVKCIEEKEDFYEYFIRREKLIQHCEFKQTLRPFVEYIRR